MQNSPVALVLVDAQRAHRLRQHRGAPPVERGAKPQRAALRRCAGARAGRRCAAPPRRRATACSRPRSTGSEETFHLSQRAFILQGRHFSAVSAQAADARAVAPGSLDLEEADSRAESRAQQFVGAAVVAGALRRGDCAARRLFDAAARCSAAIAERAEHLHHFVSGYAAFAKLPAPRPERVEWAAFVADLARQQPFSMPAALPELPGWFDRVQVEQALINLLKNAHEAGGAGSRGGTPDHAASARISASRCAIAARA